MLFTTTSYHSWRIQHIVENANGPKCLQSAQNNVHQLPSLIINICRNASRHRGNAGGMVSVGFVVGMVQEYLPDNEINNRPSHSRRTPTPTPVTPTTNSHAERNVTRHIHNDTTVTTPAHNRRYHQRNEPPSREGSNGEHTTARRGSRRPTTPSAACKRRCIAAAARALRVSAAGSAANATASLVIGREAAAIYNVPQPRTRQEYAG